MLNQLRDIGLGENEAKVYIAMLELGPATVLQIAGKAGINRPTTYVQIESLKQRGLVEVMTKGKKSLFTAKEPSSLDAMLEREAKEIEVQKSELMKVLPQLQTMFDLAGTKPVVRYFEGIQGLRDMQAEFLRSHDKMLLGISSVDAVLDVFPNQDSSYTQARLRKGIRTKFIYTSSQGPILPEDSPELLRETRFIDPKKLPFTADVSIFDESVAVASLRPPYFGAIITQREIAASFKNLFELVWTLVSK